ncbi:MAG: glycosyltransferase family 2 protein [Maritimibacter sp.]
MSLPSWGIVATLDEPATLVAAFVGYHLSIGAREIHVFFDRPAPEAMALIAPLPGVKITLADQAFWDEVNAGHRPKHIMKRQAIITRIAYRQAQVDWLLHCDADEFIADGEAFTALLEAQDKDVSALRLGMLERVHIAGSPRNTIFQGAFRRSKHRVKTWGEVVYGQHLKFLTNGMTGHDLGKGVARTGRDLRLGIHGVHWREGGLVGAEVAPDMLLHFDGLTQYQFLMKLMLRAGEKGNLDNSARIGTHRSHQVRFVHKHMDDPQALRDFADTLQVVGQADLRLMRRHGAIDMVPFEPFDALSALGLDLDLSTDAFDASLKERAPKLAAMMPKGIW